MQSKVANQVSSQLFGREERTISHVSGRVHIQLTGNRARLPGYNSWQQGPLVLESAPLSGVSQFTRLLKELPFQQLEEALLGFTEDRFDCVVKRGK